MKIVLHAFNYSGNDSGIGLISRNLMERLVKRGHKVFAIAQQKNLLTKKDMPLHENMNGVEVIRIKRSKIPVLGSIIYYKKVLNEIKKINPDILHEMGLCGIGIITKKILKVPYCVMGQGVDMFSNPWLFDKIVGIPSIKKADRVLAPTNHLAKYIKKKFTERDIDIIRSGVNVEEFNKKYIKEKNGAIKIVAVGRLIPAKGFDITLKALSILKDRKIIFQIIGSGFFREELTKLTKKLDIEEKVVFLGQLEHKKVINILQEADIFVYPTSHPETCSLALLEANAAGLPIITTDLQGNSELVHHGKNGYLLESVNPEKVAKLIEKLIDGPKTRKSFSEYSLNNSKRFNWDDIVLELEKVYEEVVQEHNN